VTHRYTVVANINREYRRFNAMGTQLTVLLSPPPDDSDPVSHLVYSMSELFVYVLRKYNDSDIVGVTVSNEDNVQYIAIGLSFRWKDQLSGDVVWIVLENVAQSNVRFNALDKLVITVYSVRMPSGFSRKAIKAMVDRFN
jgi:hypothetical protein